MTALAIAAAESLADEAREWGNRRIELASVTADLQQAWQGQAANATEAQLMQLGAAIEDLIGELTFLAETLLVEGVALEDAIQRREQVNSADCVTADGDAGAPECEIGPVERAYRDAEAAVQQADEALVKQLARGAEFGDPAEIGALTSENGTQQSVMPPAKLPEDPHVLATMWHGLSPHERALWALAHPGIEDRAGLPTSSRDALNRLQIAASLGAESGSEATPRFMGLAQYLRDVPTARVLRVDAAGRGAVADGDPATASRVLTFVPGTGSSMAKMDTDGERATALCAAASAAKPDPNGKPCVAVLWMDQEAPQSIKQAAHDREAAATAAPRLQQFQQDLRRTSAAGLGVIGYSYGGVVVGAAADDGLDAEKLAFVAAPGATVDHVSELELIDAEGKHEAGSADSVLALAERWDVVPWWGLTEWHGEAPTSADFGADRHISERQSMLSGPSTAHGRYFDPDSVPLTELGRALGEIPAR